MREKMCPILTAADWIRSGVHGTINCRGDDCQWKWLCGGDFEIKKSETAPTFYYIVKAE